MVFLFWYHSYRYTNIYYEIYIYDEEVNLIDAMRCEYRIVLFHFELIWPVNRILLLYSVRLDRPFVILSLVAIVNSHVRKHFSAGPSHADLIARWFDIRNLFAAVQEIEFIYESDSIFFFSFFLISFSPQWMRYSTGSI